MLGVISWLSFSECEVGDPSHLTINSALMFLWGWKRAKVKPGGERPSSVPEEMNASEVLKCAL